MKLYFTLIYLVRLLQSTTCIDYDGWLNIRIEHSLNCNGNKYCPRGNISLKSIRAGTAVIDQTHFNNKHIQELKELADVDGFYTIRTVVTSADIKEAEFLSSMKAQAFLDNGLSDMINAWVLPNGAVIAVSFQVTNKSQPLVQDKEGYSINSNFFLRYVEQAPVPDTASYIQKLEREREAREKGELKDNRSFLAKYWMYIVPIAIFVMISGATNPEPPAQAAR
ncbi:ER membrane protein complex subunit 10 [Pectinophora gossypiella]|uniref:ER membrane protein complex subunit 10 n=1 Tax=Pectinophora gossypiella TaxID=13191 RepID=A0A1E1WFQ7_PECGO|nr:ER membrane protein complex subunit 10 [Pectinophora gossypiella]